MAVENYTNLAQTTLASGISSGATSLTVATGGGANFPTTNFRAWISDGVNTEFIFVGSRSSDTFSSITRNYENVSGAPFAFSTGASVLHGPTAGLLIALFQRFVSQGAFSSLPSAGGSGGENGALYVSTDMNLISISNGSAWKHFPFEGPSTGVPPTGSWSWVNQGSATVDTSTGIFLTAPAVSGDNLRCYVRSIPSAPYTLVARVIPSMGSTAHSCGLCLRNSSGGGIITFAHQASAVAGVKWNSATSFNSSYSGGSFTFTGSPIPTWFKITDDNTNRQFYYSQDGIHWVAALGTVTRTDFITPDQYGVFVNVNSTTAGTPSVYVPYWLQT